MRRSRRSSSVSAGPSPPIVSGGGLVFFGRQFLNAAQIGLGGLIAGGFRRGAQAFAFNHERLSGGRGFGFWRVFRRSFSVRRSFAIWFCSWGFAIGVFPLLPGFIAFAIPGGAVHRTFRRQVGLVLGAGFGFLHIQQALPIRHGDLVVIRMDFAKGQEAVAIAAIFHKGRLQAGFYPHHFGPGRYCPSGRGVVSFQDQIRRGDCHPSPQPGFPRGGMHLSAYAWSWGGVSAAGAKPRAHICGKGPEQGIRVRRGVLRHATAKTFFGGTGAEAAQRPQGGRTWILPREPLDHEGHRRRRDGGRDGGHGHKGFDFRAPRAAPARRKGRPPANPQSHRHRRGLQRPGG
jgi:hypothetical protein